jgi:preprotein translocase subunit SecY
LDKGEPKNKLFFSKIFITSEILFLRRFPGKIIPLPELIEGNCNDCLRQAQATILGIFFSGNRLKEIGLLRLTFLEGYFLRIP